MVTIVHLSQVEEPEFKYLTEDMPLAKKNPQLSHVRVGTIQSKSYVMNYNSLTVLILVVLVYIFICF